MFGFTVDAMVTLNVLVEVPSAVEPLYVVSVAVAVTDVAFGMYEYHVAGIVNEVDEVFAATFTVTDGALEYVNTSL